MQINGILNSLVNGGVTLDVGESQDFFVFDGYSLANRKDGQLYGNMILTLNDRDLFAVDLKTFIPGLADGQQVQNKRYDSLTLQCTMAIYGESHADLQARLDEFKGETQKENADFEVNYEGEIRVFKGTIRNIKVDDFLVSINRVNVSFEIFLTSLAVSKSYTTRHSSGLTGNSIFVIDNDGSYEAYPKVVIVFGASGNTGVTEVLLRNKKVGDATGYEVVYTGALTNSDVLTFDYENADLNINGVGSQTFTGPMTPLIRGKTSFEVEVTATTKSYSVYILYQKRWL